MQLSSQPPVTRRLFAEIPFAVINLTAATKMICELTEDLSGGFDVHLLNAYSISLAEQDEAYRQCLVAASCNLPDGRPLSLMTKFSKQPLMQVRGPSLLERVMDEGRARGVRHYLLGSTPHTLALLERSLEDRYPGVKIVGSMSPPFRNLTSEEHRIQDQRIAETDPDIIWVGLGTPKQDFEAHRLASDSGFLAIAVGAAFDFSAGTKKEAPGWMTRIGVEWIYRFGSEPRRLWKRYLIGNLVFLYSVIRRTG